MVLASADQIGAARPGGDQQHGAGQAAARRPRHDLPLRRPAGRRTSSKPAGALVRGRDLLLRANHRNFTVADGRERRPVERVRRVGSSISCRCDRRSAVTVGVPGGAENRPVISRCVAL